MFRLAAVDLDDTLLDYRSEEQSASEGICGYIAGLTGVSIDIVREAYSDGKILERKGGTKDILRYRFEYVAKKFDLTIRDMDSVHSLYQKLRLAHGKVLDGACTLLASLQQWCDDVVLITNGDYALQKRRCDRHGLSPFLTSVFASSHLGCSKPSHAFFSKVAEATGIPISQWIVVGDSFEIDLRFPGECGAFLAMIGAARCGVVTAGTPRDLVAELEDRFSSCG